MRTLHNAFLNFFLWIFIPFYGIAQQGDIRPERLKELVSFLASDELEGRHSGSSGDTKAAAYILEHFRIAGLNIDKPFGLQSFDVVMGATPGPGNRLRIDGHDLKYGLDFVSLSFSANVAAAGELVFAGYGLKLHNDSLEWDEWKGLDVAGKWALILRGTPEGDQPGSPFAAFASERDKVLIAKDHGVAGVIFVNGPSFQEKDGLMDMFYDKSPSNAGIPVFQISREMAGKFLEPTSLVLNTIEKQITEGRNPASAKLGLHVDGYAEVLLTRMPTYNIVGLLEGTDPALKDEYIVVGAHYDHLGMGGPGSGSRRPDTSAVHYGADDNASGVAGIIELAYAMIQSRSNRRSVLFVAFGAEEMGLLGSRYFVEHPPLGLNQVSAMMNFDMIGRLKEDRSLLIGGTGTSLESEEILQLAGKNHTLELAFSPEGFGASDHASFYAQDIPVFFLSTGAHEDYHTPDDKVDRINFPGMNDVLGYANDVLKSLVNGSQKLSFQESGPKSRPRHGRGYKITLGIMPDFAGTSGDGLRVDAVRPEGPAGQGGMKKGDLITAIEGKKVSSIYDYMARLKSLENGQSITVDVLRDGIPLVLIIQI